MCACAGYQASVPLLLPVLAEQLHINEQLCANHVRAGIIGRVEFHLQIIRN